MKRILFPTDFSETVSNAFVHALTLANQTNAELILLHTFEYPIIDTQSFPANYQQLFDSLELAQFEMFKTEVYKLRAIAEVRKLNHVKMAHRLINSPLLQAIKTAIKEDAIDFVVMGTSGASGWMSTFLGTQTGEVIKGVDVPVLAVPLEAIHERVATIGFTTRYRAKDKVALQEVLIIARKLHAAVKCLYVKKSNSDVTDETVAQWNSDFAAEPVQFFILPSDEVETTILEFITNQGIDIIAMTTYKRSFFESLFATHFSEKMTYASTIPVLVLHE